MANRFIRGTFIRNSWDFYEVGTAFAFASQFTVAGGVGLMLINNGVGNSYLDVYRAEFSSSITGPVYWVVGPASAPTNPQEPQAYYNSPCQLDLGGPPGLMVVFSTYNTAGVTQLRSRNDAVSYDVFELANGGAFVSLPPSYGLAVLFTSSGNQTMSSTIWYQSITDHTPPAN